MKSEIQNPRLETIAEKTALPTEQFDPDSDETQTDLAANRFASWTFGFVSGFEIRVF
jgi:hypothetical protein